MTAAAAASKSRRQRVEEDSEDEEQEQEEQEQEEQEPSHEVEAGRERQRQRRPQKNAAAPQQQQQQQHDGEIPSADIHVPDSFTPAHRLFLHCWLSRRFGTEDEALELYRHCCNKHEIRYVKADFAPFIQTINSALASLDMRLASLNSPKDGTRHWALINTAPDDSSMLATRLTPSELQLFRKTLLLICAAQDLRCASTAVLRESATVRPPLTRLAAERAVDAFVRDGWLCCEDGMLGLSMRSQMELVDVIKELGEDNIRECSLCRELALFNFQRCADEECEGRLHDFCASRLFATATSAGSRKCQVAGCGAEWTAPVPERTFENEVVPQASGKRSGKRSQASTLP